MTPSAIHYHDGSFLIGSEAYRLAVSSDGGASWRSVGRIPRRSVKELAARGQVLRRLARAGIRHAIPSPDGRAIVVVAGRRCWRVGPLDLPLPQDATGDTEDERRGVRVEPGAALVGSRPLCPPVIHHGAIYYGEYRSNPQRSPVHVWKSDDGGRTFQPAWRFRRARHVHGVFSDPFDPALLWVTTGDDDDESAIWRTDDGFATLERVAWGSQQYRAVQLVPREQWIYFGSDTPLERNHLYRLDRTRGTREKLDAVDGSVFWGAATPDGAIVFTTVVEPSEVTRHRYADLWTSRDGEQWTRALSLERSPLPNRSFEHAQLRLPAGPGEAGAIRVTPYATRERGVRRVEV